MRHLSATNLPLTPMPSLSLNNAGPRSLLHRRTTQQSDIRSGDAGAGIPNLSAGLAVPGSAGPRGLEGTEQHPAELLTLFAGTPSIANPDGPSLDVGASTGMNGDTAETDFSNWFDSVNLVDLLGELPVSSEDPFGFGTDWGAWQT